MNCYKCGSPLGSGKHCLHCGADVAAYRKIVRRSNAYYNAGLNQARVRNLSAAALSLEKALQYDKKNTAARNLLGLVYYELGEIVDALTEWVVSKDLQPEDNPAGEYIDRVSHDKKTLDNMNQAVKKFNQALDTARHEGADLAIITLRTVISLNPGYVKAYQLLALLLIREGDISGAGRVIKKGLQKDRGNVALQAYASEIHGKTGRGRDNVADKIREAAEKEVLVPEYRETPKKVQFLIGAGAALVICVLAYVVLIGPSIQRSANNDINQNAISYYEKIEEKNAQVDILTVQAEELQTELTAAKNELAVYTGEGGLVSGYENLITALSQYVNKEYLELLDTYELLGEQVPETDAAQTVYEFLGEYVKSNSMLSGIMETAREQFAQYKYSLCMETCLLCLDINPEFDEALYYMGLCYEANGDDASARPYFKQIVEKQPSSSYYSLAKKRTS